MTKVIKNRFRAGTAVLVVLMLLIGIFPTQLWGGFGAEAADDEITIYFDTYNNEKDVGTSGWTKDMEMYVWSKTEAVSGSYSDSKSSSGGGTFYKMKLEPTLASQSSDGKIYSITFSSKPSSIIFNSTDSWTGDVNKQSIDVTSGGAGSGIENEKVYYVCGSFNVGSSAKRNIWANSVSDYNWQLNGYVGQTFNLFNMSSSTANLIIKFTNGTDSVYLKEDGSCTTERTVRSFAGRTQYTNITVPDSGTSAPYTKVEIYQDGVVDEHNVPKILKQYIFSDNKLLGRTFYYGITEFSDSTLDYGDGKALCYYDENRTSISYGAKVVYLDEKFASGYNNIEVEGVNTTAVTTDGNANYVTTGEVTATQSNNGIISVVYNNATYNLFWSATDSDNLITINDNVAFMAGKYTVQSENNDIDGQKYITVRADMYDYQYDYFDQANPQYTYTTAKPEYESGNGAKDKTSTTENSKKANAKRPYLVINEALSASNYGKTTYPMYLGQFWLPLYTGTDPGFPYTNNNWKTSSQAYTSATARAQRAGHNKDSDMYYISQEQEDGYYMNFGFGKKLANFTWAANLAYRTENQNSGTYYPYNAVAQGLVNPKLSANSDSGKLLAYNSTETVPYFDTSWWTRDGRDNFTTSQNTTVNLGSYIKSYENLDFPFFERTSAQVEETGFANGYTATHMLSNVQEKYSGNYYVFDSQHYAVYVDENGKLNKYKRDQNLVYDNYGSTGSGQTNETGQTYGLFPFNKPENGGANSDALHYGFGVKYSIDFYLNENGTIDGTPDGTPITFTFQGDDDVWVFIDDQLILDMGGAHKNALGEINFKDKTTWISSVGYASDSSIVSSSKNGKMIDLTTTDVNSYLTTGKHTIRMFYMERGMLNSNLYVMFNLPLSITNYEVQEDTDFSNVNSAFLKSTVKVANNDQFAYQIENQGTDPGKVYDSSYGLPTYEYITRKNTDQSLDLTTDLSGQNPISTTPTTVTYNDIDNIYFKAKNWWKDAGCVVGAYMFNNDTDKAKYVTATEVDLSQYIWRVPYDDRYNTVIFVRAYKSYNKEYNTIAGAWDDWSSTSCAYFESNNQGEDNIIDIYNRNMVEYKSKGVSPWSDVNYTLTKTVYKQTKTSQKFSPGTKQDNETEGEIYSYLVNDSGGGVTYRMNDPFALNTTSSNVSNTEYYNLGSTNVYRNTLTDGIIPLQYGQLASISKQFQTGSKMKVTQLDTLYKPTGTAGDSYSQASERTVSKYYKTYTKSTTDTGNAIRPGYAGMYNGNDVKNTTMNHIETMYSGTTNYSNYGIINLQAEDSNGNIVTKFNFSDPTDSKSAYVHLRQVFANEPNLANLVVQKAILEGDSVTDITTTFKFQIVFSNIFGSTVGDGEYRDNTVPYIRTKLDGTTEPDTLRQIDGVNNAFELRAGESIEIKNIPVGTKYYITELGSNDATQMYTLNSDYSVNLGTADNPTEIDGNTTAIAFNKRKTGNIQLVKELYDLDGTTQYTTNTTEFTVRVCLTPATGVAVSNYAISYNHSGGTATGAVIGEDNSFDVKIKPSDGIVTISGIPYGTTYTVEEIDSSIPSGYKKLSSNNVEYNNLDSTVLQTIDSDNGEKVTVKNQVEPITMPETGGSPLIFLLPFGIIAILLSGIAVVIYKKKLSTVEITESRGR